MTGARPNIETALENRDLRAVGWHVLAVLMRNENELAKFASPAASIMRVLLALGQESPERAEMLLETAVVGAALHGLPPRTPEQWRIANRLYDEATLEDFRRWKPADGWFGRPGANVDFDPDWASDLPDVGAGGVDDGSDEIDWRD